MKTIIIGIDGGEWSVIDSMIEDGRMPHTSSLIEGVCREELKSTVPPVSPLAWNSIYTGVNPGKHGIYDFSTFEEDYSRRSINSSDRKATPFWEILNDSGHSTGLFKLPFTYPVSEVQGFFISGFPAPGSGSKSVYPKDLRETVGEPADLLEDSSLITEGNFEPLQNNLHEIVSYQTDVLLSCLEYHDTETVMAVYDGSDRIQHFFWKHMDPSHPRHESSKFQDAIYRYYELFDQELGRLLENISENANVILISDHGFGPLETDINIEYWLWENGYLTWEDESHETSQSRSLPGNIVWNLWSVIKEIGAEEYVRSIVPEGLYSFGKNLSSLKKTNYNWDDTTAFFGTISGQSIENFGICNSTNH